MQRALAMLRLAAHPATPVAEAAQAKRVLDKFLRKHSIDIWDLGKDLFSWQEETSTANADVEVAPASADFLFPKKPPRSVQRTNVLSGSGCRQQVYTHKTTCKGCREEDSCEDCRSER